MLTLQIIEDFHVLKNISRDFSPCLIVPTLHPLPLEQGKKLSMTPLSEQFPVPLMLYTSPRSLKGFWKSWLARREFRSERLTRGHDEVIQG